MRVAKKFPELKGLDVQSAIAQIEQWDPEAQVRLLPQYGCGSMAAVYYNTRVLLPHDEQFIVTDVPECPHKLETTLSSFQPVSTYHSNASYLVTRQATKNFP